jgi:hypothetical protein
MGKMSLLLALCAVQVSSFVQKPTTTFLDISDNVAFHNSVFCSTALRSTNSDTSIELNDRFSRWRFLQGILEEEADNDIVNQVLFQVLEGALKYTKPKGEDAKETGSPEITTVLKEKMEKVLSTATNGYISALGDSDGSVLQHLEGLLPDPLEEEDAARSVWDTVMELHGRGAVQFNERNPTPEWKISCVVARLLLHFDFLTLGIVTSPQL